MNILQETVKKIRKWFAPTFAISIHDYLVDFIVILFHYGVQWVPKGKETHLSKFGIGIWYDSRMDQQTGDFYCGRHYYLALGFGSLQTPPQESKIT